MVPGHTGGQCMGEPEGLVRGQCILRQYIEGRMIGGRTYRLQCTGEPEGLVRGQCILRQYIAGRMIG
jgi:hypothetical protein